AEHFRNGRCRKAPSLSPIWTRSFLLRGGKRNERGHSDREDANCRQRPFADQPEPNRPGDADKEPQKRRSVFLHAGGISTHESAFADTSRLRANFRIGRKAPAPNQKGRPLAGPPSSCCLSPEA